MATLAALLEVASEAEEVVAMVELLVVEVVDDRSTSPTFVPIIKPLFSLTCRMEC